MKKLIAVLALVAGCGAQAKAVEHAEYECLVADLHSLEAKLQAGTSASGLAVSLTEGELVCAAEALTAKAQAAAVKAAPAPVDAATK